MASDSTPQSSLVDSNRRHWEEQMLVTVLEDILLELLSGMELTVQQSNEYVDSATFIYTDGTYHATAEEVGSTLTIRLYRGTHQHRVVGQLQ